MKPQVEWDETYVLSLPFGEHSWVEFKGTDGYDFEVQGNDRSRALNELSKQISAFANSGGGSIVLGVVESRDRDARSLDRGGIPLNCNMISTKEWLEDVVPNLVEPSLTAFDVYVIQGSGPNSGITPGRGIIVVAIQDSVAAPHQALDNKYYGRIAGKSKPLGHRFVLDIMGRAKHPIIEVSLDIDEDKDDPADYLRVWCKNTGRVYANYVNGSILIPSVLEPRKAQRVGNIKGEAYSIVLFENTHKDIVGYKPGIPGFGAFAGVDGKSYYTTRYSPVLPGLGFFHYILLGVTIANLSLPEGLEIKWSVFADNAEERTGIVSLTELVKLGKSVSSGG
jgi:hypothetical protein